MAKRAIALANTFVNILETNTAIINGPNGYSYLKSVELKGIVPLTSLLAKPITRLLVVKPHFTRSKDAIKAYKLFAS